jgi:hypothetical protein
MHGLMREGRREPVLYSTLWPLWPVLIIVVGQCLFLSACDRMPYAYIYAKLFETSLAVVVQEQDERRSTVIRNFRKSKVSIDEARRSLPNFQTNCSTYIRGFNARSWVLGLAVLLCVHSAQADNTSSENTKDPNAPCEFLDVTCNLAKVGKGLKDIKIRKPFEEQPKIIAVGVLLGLPSPQSGYDYNAFCREGDKYPEAMQPAMHDGRNGVVGGKMTLSAAQLITCDKLIKSGTFHRIASNSTNASASSDPVPADHRTIEQTELNLFFEKYEQPGGGQIAVWPRVAITVIDAPAWHLEDTSERMGGRIVKSKTYPSDGCWKFKAKVWESAQKSHDVAPFYFCTGDPPQRQPINQLLIAYQIWSGLRGTSTTRVTPGSTGIRRTEGPNYPDTPLPTSAVYQRTNFGSSFTADVACGILSATGIDFSNFNDHRVWFNLAPSLEPK